MIIGAVHVYSPGVPRESSLILTQREFYLQALYMYPGKPGKHSPLLTPKVKDFSIISEAGLERDQRVSSCCAEAPKAPVALQ